MSILLGKTGATVLMMGNEAIARGALEAGVRVATAYPGTPSSDIIEVLSKVAKTQGLYVEWSINEKVALEISAAASFAGLRAITAMKQNGLNVASDFLLNLNLSGVKGGMVVVVCDDPSAHSSSNEQDSRLFAKIADLPLLEPSSFQEAKDMTRYAFELSEEINNVCLIRSVTRISHARGNVTLGELAAPRPTVHFDTGKPMNYAPVLQKHRGLHQMLGNLGEKFNSLPFNRYEGPDSPDLLIITSGSGWGYAQEALHILGLKDSVGVLKLGTTWPLPERFLARYTAKVKKILIVEEVDPFLEGNIKELAADLGSEMGSWTFFGKRSGHIPPWGELTPDRVIEALNKIFNLNYQAREAKYVEKSRVALEGLVPDRILGFCAGCPHRASFWSIKNALKIDGQEGFVTGDIGCYALGRGPAGFYQIKTGHAMGSGTGVACGFGKLKPFGFNQPVIAVCGDSTFFHAAMPALVNAKYDHSDFTLVLLDNSATAMTGFQPHPGTGFTALGESVAPVHVEKVCRSLDIPVVVRDPYDMEATREALSNLIENVEGVKVLILRRKCALMNLKEEKPPYKVFVDPERCLGEDCGCNRLCTRVFRCPGLIWEQETQKAKIDEVICVGCGVCVDICPKSAIKKEKN